MRTNSTATLYNHYTDKETGKTVYKRTIITSVNWQESQKTNVIDKGLVSADQINIFIPFNANFEGKEYIGPKEYRRLSDEDKEKYFTFDNNDYIIKGKISEDVPIEKIKQSYDNVSTIISVLVCDNGSPSIRHFEVGGK